MAERAYQASGRLPDFLGVGPPRTGTTWLDMVLRGHVGLPRAVKEVDFFVKHYARGIDWYRRYFADCDPGLPAGEICPSYYGSDAARARIAEHIPRCRIICTFRDPIQVLFSFWKLARRNAWTQLDFAAYARKGWETRGEGLAGWIATFGRDRVLTLIYDELTQDPQRYLDRVCDFLGVARIQLADPALLRVRVNGFSRQPRSAYLARKGRKLRDRLQSREHYGLINLLTRAGFWRLCFDGGPAFPPLDPALEAELRVKFRPQVEMLERLTGYDLGAWKGVAAKSAGARAAVG
ncbi:MAG TPA: sulfotransferase [Candidatus Binataceae bacterium]|nr:sulfotransferase [Candidatus Binataceae bacterium]